MDYSFLNSVYQEYWQAKEEELSQIDDEDIQILYSPEADLEGTPFGKLLNELNMNRETFIKTYVEPFQNQDFAVLQQIAHFQSVMVKDKALSFHDIPLLFRVERFHAARVRPLQWLTVQVHELHLKGFQVDKVGIIQPYYQCRFCGRLDRDPRGKAFNEKRHFCHVEGCQTSSQDLRDHPPGCCFAYWKRIKKHFRQKLKRLSPDKPQIKEAFLEFCDGRLEANKAIREDVREAPAFL